MSDERTKEPKIRFKGYVGEWEERKLSEGTSKIGDGLHGTPNYSENGNVYFINGNNLANGKIIITKDTKFVTELEQSKDDKLLDENTILISINGTIGNLAVYNGEKVMLGKSVAYLIVSEFEKRFLYSYLQSPNMLCYFMNNLTGTTIKNLGLKTIRDTKIYFPSHDEQKKIGSFFKQLDDTIAIHQRELDLLKQTKQTYLQKMFPKAGEDRPEIRFAGFTEAWEEQKFGDVWERSSERNKDLQYTPDQVISVAQMKLKPLDRSSKDEYMKTYNVFHYGDIAFEGNKSKQYSFGRFVLNNLQDGIVSHVFNVYRPKLSMNIDFMKIYINNEQVMKHKLVKSTTKTLMMTTLNHTDIIKQKLAIPSIKEQQKIGSFFKQLDDTITLHQRKLDSLKEMKKSLLQQMFV